MTTIITEQLKSRFGTYLTITCGNTTANVAIYDHGVQVCCHNASHRTWRKSGKLFRTWDEAFKHYRSSEMQAILELAQRPEVRQAV